MSSHDDELLTEQIAEHVDRARRWVRQEAAPAVRRARARAATWARRDALPGAVHRLRALDEAMASRSRADLDRSPKASALRLGAVVLVLTLVGAATALPGLLALDHTIASAGDALLDVEPLPDEFDPLDQRSRVLAADGSLLAILSGPENRALVSLDEVPQVVRNAVIATEDATFYEHNGVNHSAMMRAVFANLREDGVTQGGSTITQQYVKNTLLTPERTVQRKLQEAVYATRLERELSKDEILERYLNLTYFGNGVYGVGAAAEFYFGRPVGELGAPEAAMLAGLIRSPEVNDPIDHPEAARERRDIVLRQMAVNDHLTEEEAAQAQQAPLGIEVTPLPPPEHPFFVEYVKRTLLDDPRLGEERRDRAALLFGGGLEIRTTLDPVSQQAARDSIAQHLPDPAVDPMGGVVSLDPHSGAIHAMAVGPKGFGTCEEGSPEEVAEQAAPEGEEPEKQDPGCTSTKVNPLAPGMGGSGRQPGSTFKAILDTAALEAGIPTSWHTDTRPRPIPECGVPGEPWTPQNYSGGSAGVLDMPEGIRRSNNVFHAQLIAEIGPQAVVDMAHRLGIVGVDGELEPYCSLGLGAQEVFPLDMAQAFGTLAARGKRCEPFAVLEVRDRNGEPLLSNQPACEQVLDQQVADTMTTMLERVVTSGTGRAARIGRPVAGKTGTTDDYVDAWFVGYVPQLVTAAWVGHEQPRCPEGESVGCGPMRGILGHRTIAGGTIPARMWAAHMGVATQHLEVLGLPRVPLARYTPPPPPAPEPKPARPPEDRGGGQDDKEKKKEKEDDDD